MKPYKIGEKYDEFKRQPEGIRVDITPNGLDVFIGYIRPTKKEIEAIRTGKFKIKQLVKSDILFLFFKFGDLAWMDAPYTPHLSQNLVIPNTLASAKGLALNVTFFDPQNGELHGARLIGLDTKFTVSLINNVYDLKSKSFNHAKYNANLMSIYQSYTTRQLLKMCK